MSANLSRHFLLAGIAAPVVYVLAVLAGGALWPAYSHTSQHVSDLIAARAPTKSLLDPVFAVYNLLTLIFAVALLTLARNVEMGRPKYGVAAALTLLVEAIAGLLTLAFPEPAGGAAAPMNAVGVAHIVFASVSSLASMGAALLVGLWLRQTRNLEGYGMYSLLSAGFIFVTGAAAALATVGHLGFDGLLERVTIGGFLQWLVVTAWVSRSLQTRRLALRR